MKRAGRRPQGFGSGDAPRPDTAGSQPPAREQRLDHRGLEQQAIALLMAERFDEATAVYESLIAEGSQQPVVLGNLGALYGQQGRADEAIDLLQRCLRLDPANPEAHANLGLVQHEQKGRIEEAIRCFLRALELRPDHVEAHANLANALLEQGELEAALRSYRQAIAINPGFSDAYKNYGNALLIAGDLQAALAAYRRAVQLRPAHPEANKNLAMAELLIGDYRNGLARYEARFQCRADRHILSAVPPGPRWNGEPLAAGSRLLLVSEQGLGDTLQFMRYALPLRRQGLAISLCAPSRLHGLIQASGIDAAPLSPEQASAVGVGMWVPMLSLARHLNVSPAEPIVTAPYIHTGADRLERWRRRLAGERRPIIAINWQGNPAQERSIATGRSLPLSAFAPIAALEGVSLLSVQKGPGSEQLQRCGFRDRFVSCQELVEATWDFEETAAILASCDLVISSDTAVAHLAGGMGRPTWLLLKAIPEWRWGLEGEGCFWYPSMRLCRQRRIGDWPELMERLASDLAGRLSSGAFRG